MSTKAQIKTKFLVMNPKTKLSILAIAGVGAAFGLGVIISASIVLSDEVFLRTQICSLHGLTRIDQQFIDEACKFQSFWKAATSLGIIAGIFQYVSAGAVFLLGRAKIWSGVNMFIALLCGIAFDLSLDNGAFESALTDYSNKFLIFAVLSLLNLIFSIGGAIAVFALDRQMK